MLLALLFGPALVAVYFVGRNGYTGVDVAKPFRAAALVTFVFSGFMLVGTFFGGEQALNFLLLGTAAFGGAISCGVTALVIWYRDQRRIAAELRRRGWPHGEET